MKILKKEDLIFKDLESSSLRESYSRSAVLSEALGCKDFFIHQEILPPGRRASAPHSHANTDEFIYVLKGQATIHEGAQTAVARTGDCVCFSAGAKDLHFVSNESEEDVELLVVSRSMAKPDVVF